MHQSGMIMYQWKVLAWLTPLYLDFGRFFTPEDYDRLLYPLQPMRCIMHQNIAITENHVNSKLADSGNTAVAFEATWGQQFNGLLSCGWCIRMELELGFQQRNHCLAVLALTLGFFGVVAKNITGAVHCGPIVFEDGAVFVVTFCGPQVHAYPYSVYESKVAKIAPSLRSSQYLKETLQCSE